jgi:hypothetical protein
VIIDAQVEEFEHGAWVADLSSLDAFSGSFDMAGSKWTGTKVTERVDFSRYYTPRCRWRRQTRGDRHG